jgi:hypothetical protein
VTTRSRAFGLTLLISATAFAAQSQAQPYYRSYTSYTAHYGQAGFGPTAAGTAAPRPPYLAAGEVDLASSFTAVAGGPLAYIDLTLVVVNGYDGATISLTTDNGSGQPYLGGSPLEFWVVSKLPIATALHTRVKSIAHPTLSSGTKYWIIVCPLGFDTELEWYQSTIASKGTILTYDAGLNWSGYSSATEAFDVYVTHPSVD